MNRILITNGDHAANALAAHFSDAEILIWRDVLVEGPVPGTVDDEALADIRAIHIENSFGMRDVRDDFTRRNQAFQKISTHQPIELWFETDLHDQLQIAELLARLAPLKRSAPTLLALCEPPLSSHIDDAARELRQLAPDDFQFGTEMWSAFRNASPEALVRHANSLGPLPEARAALARLLEEYPSRQDGLGRIERYALLALRDGAITPGLAFRHYQQSEQLPFLGDLGFFHRLDLLAQKTHPLIAGLPAGGIAKAARENMTVEYTETSIELTDVGHDILEGRKDFVAINGIDRWIGGVHLTKHSVWRFDPASRHLSRD